MIPDWQRLFPDADYRPAMGLRRGTAEDFWRDWDGCGTLVQERERWLQAAPQHCTSRLPGSEQAVAEAMAWMRHFSARPEPDWVLLADPADNPKAAPQVIAGEVVFPSSWSLPEKLGLPLPAVHEPVPGLETSLGASIALFLQKLEPGPVWLRENWGLAADAELNHHPARALPSLPAQAALATTWLRLEHQCLLRLPHHRTVLFGIRVTCHQLSALAELPGMAERIHRALASMAEPMARYKGLHHARPALLEELAARL